MMNPLRYLLAGQRWLRKMVAMLRELRTHEQHILAARDLIASELRHNARIVAAREAKAPFDWLKFGQQIELARWEQHGGEVSILRKRHPELWEELVSGYEALRYSVRNIGPSISSAALADLATRLGDAEL